MTKLGIFYFPVDLVCVCLKLGSRDRRKSLAAHRRDHVRCDALDYIQLFLGLAVSVSARNKIGQRLCKAGKLRKLSLCAEAPLVIGHVLFTEQEARVDRSLYKLRQGKLCRTALASHGAPLIIVLTRLPHDQKLACELSLTPATIYYHLKKMESAGIVNCSRTQFYMIYSVNRDIFDKPLYALIKKDSPTVDTEEKYKKEVLSHFFKYGKLTQIPMQRKKREIVLQEIAKQFEPGIKYEETEVNDIIHRFHDDHCTIRREMIACGIMVRENALYWLA